VQHLVELRDRLVKAFIAIAAATVVLAIYPGPGELYDILAAPLVANLPKGGTLIATSVISPFLVPLKIMLMAAFLLPCRGCCTSCGPLCRRACTCTRRNWCCPW
jgi:sec-independent protein translocase protein TatC